MDLLWAAETASSTKESGGYWQLALVLAAIGFLGLFARWRKLRTPTIPTTSELREMDEHPNRHRDAADRAIVELLETSRSLNAQVDTKIRVLNRLVKEAEENCLRLETLLAQAKNIQSRENLPDPIPPPDTKPPGPESNPEKPGEPTFLSELHERIYRLKMEGRNTAEIAKATDLSTTEVNFIIKTF